MSYLWVFKLILLLKLCRSFDGSLKGYDTKAVRIYSLAAWTLRAGITNRSVAGPTK